MLFHFTTPRWFSKAGGWRKSENVKHFVEFVEVIANELRDVRVRITLNEPNVYAYMGFVLRSMSSGERSPRLADIVLQNPAKAHARAYGILKGRGIVGIAHNLMWFVPKSSSELDVSAANRAEEVWNWGFLKGVVLGVLKGFVGNY